MIRRFIAESTAEGVRLVQLHDHPSLREVDGHTEVDINVGDIVEFEVADLVRAALSKNGARGRAPAAARVAPRTRRTSDAARNEERSVRMKDMWARYRQEGRAV